MKKQDNNKKNWLQWLSNVFSNATLRAAVNENPSIATSTGYEVNSDTGEVTQDPAALDETARPELATLRNGLAATSAAANVGMYGPVLGAKAVDAVTANPVATGKFLTSMLGGAAVDQGIRDYTDYNGWGDLMYTKSGTRHLMEQLPENTQAWAAPTSEFLWGFTNPGFFADGITNQAIKGLREVVPAAKQIIKDAEAVNYAGMKADANNARKALTSGKTRIKVGDVEINNPELNYRQVGPGVARDFVKTGNQFGKIKSKPTDRSITLLLKKPLDNPMYKQGSLWYGIENTGSYPDLLVTAEPMSYANKYGLVSSINKGGRRIPATTLNSNNTGAYVFEPGYGYRKVEVNPEISVSLPYNRVAPTDGTINWPIVEKPIFSENSSIVGVDPRYIKDGKFDVRIALQDIEAGRTDAINFLGSDVKAASDAHNKELAARVGLSEFRPYRKANVRASIPMQKGTIASSHTEDAVWVGDRSNGYWITSEVMNGNNLGKLSAVHDDPTLDRMTISLQGRPGNSAFHETLHRGSYGTSPAIPINTPEKATSAQQNRVFYNWKTKHLLKDDYAGDYLSQSDEAAVNALEFGRILGLKPGAVYPGEAAARRMFAEGIASDPIKLSLLRNYKWDTKPKRVWDALTGKYYTLPILGIIGAGTVNATNNNAQ